MSDTLSAVIILQSYLDRKDFHEPPHEENQRRFTEPCIVVIFGATGDLTSRKLIPALYNLLKDRTAPLAICLRESYAEAARQLADPVSPQDVLDAASREFGIPDGALSMVLRHLRKTSEYPLLAAGAGAPVEGLPGPEGLGGASGDKCSSAQERKSGFCAGPFGQDAGSTYRSAPPG